MAYILQPVCTWTFKGILCTCRFLWICPYNAIQFLPREKRMARDTKQHTQSNRGEGKASASIPGSPERTSDLLKRLIKTEKEILSLKTRISCDRAAWDQRFTELQRKQEELHSQLASVGAVQQRVGSAEPGVDNGEVFEENDVSEFMEPHGGCEVASRAETYTSGHYSCPASAPSSRLPSSSSSVTSVNSWRSSVGPHRVFVPHSALDLQLGHRVRVMLPSGRISTGTVRFIGRLQGEEELHLGIQLHSPDQGTRDGRYRGHCYFHCKPGYGAFVPFHKLLMAWE